MRCSLRFGRSGFVVAVVVAALGLLPLAGCGSGSDGAAGPTGPQGPEGPEGPDGPEGPEGPSVINASLLSPEALESLDIVSKVTNVVVASPPVVTFTLATDKGVPVVGIVPFWNASHNFVRFTFAKLVPGTGGGRSNWSDYVRDGSGEPTYDNGAALVDNGDGSYVFTFKTDVASVAGVPYEPTLTHRAAGQIGASDVPLEPQNLWYDFVPSGGAVTLKRNIAVVASCNECHDRLVFHGRRFEVEYCVTCHNPDLAEGEGDMSYMTHRIHAAGTFDVLDDAISYEEVTYPQDLMHCRKCHNGDDAATPQGNNWKNVPTMAACDGCHDVFANNAHSGGAQADDSLCSGCHTPAKIEEYHLTDNATPNNPQVPAGATNFTYEIQSVSDSGSRAPVVVFRVLGNGTPVTFNGFPTTPLLPGYSGSPSFLIAYALPQGEVDEPKDYNNRGRSAAQPASVSITNVWNGTGGNTLTGPDGSGWYTATILSALWPVGATLRAVALQAYFTQLSPAVPRHTVSVVAAHQDDEVRRSVVDSARCANCHEWFEGHGGNRVYEVQVCVVCHVPNLSTSGRGADPANLALAASTADDLYGNDPLTYPEDTNNFKEMIHGIHASAVRESAYEFVRDRGTSGVYGYDWSEVTFPAEVSHCALCHLEGTSALPLPDDVLETTVRTTLTDTSGLIEGETEIRADILAARASVPNATDWINTPTASTCFYCHDSEDSRQHMQQNGGLLSRADGSSFWQRVLYGTTYETCTVCHGAGKIADVTEVHGE